MKERWEDSNACMKPRNSTRTQCLENGSEQKY